MSKLQQPSYLESYNYSFKQKSFETFMRHKVTKNIPINDVKFIPIGKFMDSSGSLSVLASHGRNDSPDVLKIKEIYLLDIPKAGTVRAGHKHRKIEECFIILNGSAKFVLVDDRNKSSTYGKKAVFFLNGESRSALFVPSQVYHALVSLENDTKCLAIANKAYDRDNPDTFAASMSIFGNELKKSQLRQ